MKFLMFAASLRKDSLNKKLIALTERIIKEESENEALHAEFSEYNMPLYNADLQNSEGFPPAVTHFIEHLQQTDAVIMSVPEYNYSIPGTLKNLIDWVSRANPMPWKQKKILLMSASPSAVGGNRGLWATRQPLEACGAIVYPDMFSLATAQDAFNKENNLADVKLQERLEANVKDFCRFVKLLSVEKA